jgi:hypothetical protein
VLRALKKQEAALEVVPTAVRRTLSPLEVAWDLEHAGAAERDERGAFVGRSYWIPGSWDVRMVYTDDIPLSRLKRIPTPADRTQAGGLHPLCFYASAQKLPHDHPTVH